MHLILKKNGVLEYTEWVYDESQDRGEYVTKIVPKDEILAHLFDTCELDVNVTLRDIFQLVADNELIFSAIMPRCYVSPYLKESQKPAEKETEIEYLELYTDLSLSNTKYEVDKPRFVQGLFLPQFHGIGKILEQDDDTGYKKGDRISWSLSYQPVSNLLDLPVKIRDCVCVYDDIDWEKKYPNIEATPVYTLLQIIYGIFWEISWYGSPEEAKLQGQIVLDIAKDAKENPEKLKEFNPEDL
ncbi:MAG: hypothetical protein QXL01_01300 [Thermoplasmatales archaeon]